MGGFSGPPSHYTQILWVFLEDKWCGSGRNKAASSWFRGSRRSFCPDKHCRRCLCLLLQFWRWLRIIYHYHERPGVGDFIVRSYLQQNPRKQEKTEALQSSLCSHRGAATSLHQKLQTQKSRQFPNSLVERMLLSTPHSVLVTVPPCLERGEKGEQVPECGGIGGWCIPGILESSR